jgi:hypothetical protein
LGHTGEGTKVGIIGLFDVYTLGLQRELGELPAIPADHGICITSGGPCPFGTPNETWGNALAEIVADAAPDAELYLAELGVRSDYYLVVDWMAAHGVQILVNPIVWTYDGPGNGTGPSAAIVDYAVSKGIAWFNTAGEMASTGTAYPSFNGTYLRTTWRDTDNDRWMDFQPPTTRVVDETLTIYCGLLLGLRWSDWGATRTQRTTSPPPARHPPPRNSCRGSTRACRARSRWKATRGCGHATPTRRGARCTTRTRTATSACT